MTTGAHLRATLGDGYYALALTAGTGTVRAVRRRLLGPSRTPKTHRLGAPAGDGLEATLAAATGRDHLVDLRDPAPPAELVTWRAARRSVGDEVSASSPATATVPCAPGPSSTASRWSGPSARPGRSDGYTPEDAATMMRISQNRTQPTMTR